MVPVKNNRQKMKGWAYTRELVCALASRGSWKWLWSCLRSPPRGKSFTEQLGVLGEGGEQGDLRVYLALVLIFSVGSLNSWWPWPEDSPSSKREISEWLQTLWKSMGTWKAGFCDTETQASTHSWKWDWLSLVLGSMYGSSSQFYLV